MENNGVVCEKKSVWCVAATQQEKRDREEEEKRKKITELWVRLNHPNRQRHHRKRQLKIPLQLFTILKVEGWLIKFGNSNAVEFFMLKAPSQMDACCNRSYLFSKSYKQQR